MKLITMDGCGRYLEQREGYNEAGEHYIIRSFMICTPHQIFLDGQIKEDRMGAACGIWGRNEMHTGFWW